MNTPIWHKVPTLEFIEVSRCGKVRTALRENTQMTRHGTSAVFIWKPRELNPFVSDNGYLRVAVLRDNFRRRYYLHRLIAMTFVDGFNDGLHVNHKNGIKTDNRPENLEWVTREENISHAWDIGLCNLRGENQPGSKLKESQVVAIKKAILDGAVLKRLSEQYNVSYPLIRKIKSGHRWAHIAV